MLYFLFDLDDTLILHNNNLETFDWIQEDRELSTLLDTCSNHGTCHIYTNANMIHANSILSKLNINEKFQMIFSRESHGFKPAISSLAYVDNIIFNESMHSHVIFFDDQEPNLKTAKQIGWTTVWISPYHQSKHLYPHINFAFPNIKDALTKINHIL